MASASKAYVVPSGEYLYRGITGLDPYDHPQAGDVASIFNTGDPRGGFGSASDAWNWQRLGYGIMPAPEALQAGMLESRGRYMGGPNNGSWDQRWQQWFGTDVTGPDGNLLLSPLHQTGLRVGQDYGARNDQGQAISPAQNEIFQGYGWLQNQLAQNPYLDPTNQLAGFRGMADSSPYAMPSVKDYTAAMSAAGGPGDTDVYGQRGLGQTQGLAGATDFDKYGLRGIEQTNQANRRGLKKLTKGIDQEMELSLATRLPEIQHAMEAAGLGRSGANAGNLLQAQNEIMAQANRDKQRVLADFQEANLGRQANAINLATQQGYGGEGQKFGALASAMGLGSQIGAQGQEGWAGRQGQAALAGLGDVFAANQGYRGAEQALWQQAMDRENQRYGMDTGNYLQSLIGGGQYALGALDTEMRGQSSALQDYMNLVNQREGWQQNALGQYLGLSDQYRAIEQERLNQQMAAGMMPLDIMLRIATGTTAPAQSQYGRTSPWAGLLAGGAQGVGAGVGNWLGGFGGGGQGSNVGMDLVAPFFGGNA